VGCISFTSGKCEINPITILMASYSLIMDWSARIHCKLVARWHRLVFIFAIIIGLLAFVIMACEDVEGATLSVDDSGGADFTSIQDAINYSNHGDIIRVNSGIYNENLIVDKFVSIIGNGSSLSIIDGGGRGNVVKLNMDHIHLHGFMIRNSGSQTHHAGLSIESTHNTISNNSFINNSLGIWLFNSRMNTIINNICSNNSNAGIWLDSSSNNIINNNTFENNWIHGIYLYQSSENSIDNNTCSNNKKFGMIIENSVLNIIHNNIFTENDEYGITLINNANDNIINNNNCSNNTYGIKLESDSNNNTIRNNNCSKNREYGIIMFDSNFNRIINSIFNNNEKAGVYLQSSSRFNTIRNNTCVNNLHGIYIENSNSNNIENNNCSNNIKHGITLLRSTYNKIMNNKCNNNEEYGTNILNNSHHNTITNINCSNNINGIYIDNSDNNIISDSSCQNNMENGLFIQNSKFNDVLKNNFSENLIGLSLISASSNSINNSILIFNDDGMRINSSYQNSISNCTFNKNKVNGIILIDSDANFIKNVTSNNNTISSIVLINSFSNSIVNTTCSNSKYGIYIDATYRIQMFGQTNFIEYNVIRDNEVGLYYIGPKTILKLVNNNTYINNEKKHYDKLQEETNTNVEDDNENGFDLFPLTIKNVCILVIIGIIATAFQFWNSFTTVKNQTDEENIIKFQSFKESNYGNDIVVSKILEIINKFFPEKIANRRIINYINNDSVNMSSDMNISNLNGQNEVELYDKLLAKQINKKANKLKNIYNDNEKRIKEEEQWDLYLSLIEKPVEFGVSNILLADDSIEDISCEIVNGKIFNVISFIKKNCKEDDNYIQLIVFGIYQHLYNYYINGLQNINIAQYPLQFRKINPYEFLIYAISSICTLYSLKDFTKNIIKDSMTIKIEINIKLLQLNLIAKGNPIDDIHKEIVEKIQYFIDKNREEISLLNNNKNEYNSKYFDSQIEKMQVLVGYLEQKKIIINNRFENRRILKEKKMKTKFKNRITSKEQDHNNNHRKELPTFKEINALLDIPNKINRNVTTNIQWYQRNADNFDFFQNT